MFLHWSQCPPVILNPKPWEEGSAVAFEGGVAAEKLSNSFRERVRDGGFDFQVRVEKATSGGQGCCIESLGMGFWVSNRCLGGRVQS